MGDQIRCTAPTPIIVACCHNLCYMRKMCAHIQIYIEKYHHGENSTQQNRDLIPAKSDYHMESVLVRTPKRSLQTNSVELMNATLTISFQNLN